jgi:hypothetical protein
VPISLKTKTVFHCKCIRPECLHEWDADTKPLRCAKCKYRTWNGEDHRRPDPYREVPVPSQIEVGTEAPRPPSYEGMLDSFTKARAVIYELIEQNPCVHSKGQCVCGEKELLTEIDKHLVRLMALRPLRSTYLVNKKRREEMKEEAAV